MKMLDPSWWPMMAMVGLCCFELGRLERSIQLGRFQLGRFQLGDVRWVM